MGLWKCTLSFVGSQHPYINNLLYMYTLAVFYCFHYDSRLKKTYHKDNGNFIRSGIRVSS